MEKLYNLDDIPPDTTIFSPVTYEASSEAKYAAVPLTSWEFPNLEKRIIIFKKILSHFFIKYKYEDTILNFLLIYKPIQWNF